MEVDNLEFQWQQVVTWFRDRFGKAPDLNAVLFLIGVRELGQGFKNFSKEQKQDLMHIAICRVLSPSGYYELEGHDEEGWPHWRLVQKLPRYDLLSQEEFLKAHIISYMQAEL
ncbi:hypothetical protein SAMN05421823_103588 [Catalinimonas alkaloidigena]|uniref:Uncharacterized protein n=1 Tax=Catalinimonas alkaloidigena TaxID=1075417 RepID=A0A1G9EUH0_9BACT|nr:hypothetical protein [Catalinimonas alkaloidigena]SDK79743.1 hypothetical protein SAMN05421823_103588 [Catalinimonas alkaloidigena]